MLLLIGYGPRFISAALRQIADPARRAAVTAVVDRGSQAARSYLLIVLVQVIVVTSVCSAVFYLLDLPAPFVLGLLVGWLSAIPYLGILLGGLAPLLVAVTEPHPLTYLVLAALLVGLQSVEVLVGAPSRPHGAGGPGADPRRRPDRLRVVRARWRPLRNGAARLVLGGALCDARRHEPATGRRRTFDGGTGRGRGMTRPSSRNR